MRLVIDLEFDGISNPQTTTASVVLMEDEKMCEKHTKVFLSGQEAELAKWVLTTTDSHLRHQLDLSPF